MRIRIFAVLLVASLTMARASEVPEDRGAMGLSQALNRLDEVGSVLHTGAHPDDENSALLAWLSRGQGVRTAYLSANRGDGGQNLLGKELFEALGVIRTEELLGARRMDHAQQFFTPTFDFGFSKTATETFQMWDHDKVLGDYVRVIRQYRPEIIVSAFTGTPADGHGHHQVAGIVTQEAFKAAADPKLYPEYGKPWQAKKLYMNGGRGGGANGGGAAGGAAGARGGGAANAGAANPVAGANAAAANDRNTGPVININVGEFDEALGRSYAEIAAEGRSLHRSQAQGSLQDKGPRNASLRLVAKTVNVADTDDFFAGTIHRLPDISQLEPALGSDLNRLEQQIQGIRDHAKVVKASAILPELMESMKLLQQIEGKATNEQAQFLLHFKDADFNEALRLAAGLVVDVVTTDDTLVPGQEFNMTVSVINGGPYNFTDIKFTNNLPPGWTAEFQQATGNIQAGQRLNQTYKVKVAADAPYTQPYWLKQPRQGARFVWPAGSPASMPFDPPLINIVADINYQGGTIEMHRPAEYRHVDPMYGELRSDINVMPALSVRVAPEIAVVPLAGNRKKEFTVTVENQNPAPVTSEVRLVVPAGWSTPAPQTVKLTRQGEKASISFIVDVPAKAGTFKVEAIAKFGTQEYKTGYQTLAYPHIQTHYIYSPAESKVEVFDVKSLVTTVGYVEGAGDSVAEALQQIGVNVTFLNAADLASGNLSRFQTIVLGIRAYAVRDDLKAYNSRLMEYVQNGGNLIVQYNTPNAMDGNVLAPYPFTITNGNDNRVTDETAPVRMLDPASPVFNIPNKISDKDFDGWVQERGLNFVGKWDPHYKPLLSSKDPGEDWRDGGMLTTKYGKGTYTYTGYDFFRELPAGVEGAYRLFLNLVSIEN